MVGPGAMHRPAHVNHGNTADGGQRRARRSSLARTASRAQPRGPLSAGRTTSLSAARASPSAPEQPPRSPHHLPQRARAPQRSPHRPSSARPSTPPQPAPPLLSALMLSSRAYPARSNTRVLNIGGLLASVARYRRYQLVPRQLLHGRHHRGDLGAAPFGCLPVTVLTGRSGRVSGMGQAHLVPRIAVLLAVGAVGVGDGLRPTWCRASRSSWRSGKASDDGLLGRQMAGGAVRRLTSHRRSPL